MCPWPRRWGTWGPSHQTIRTTGKLTGNRYKFATSTGRQGIAVIVYDRSIIVAGLRRINPRLSLEALAELVWVS